MAPLKLAIVSSHPIQYQAPLFRELARRPIDFEVLFCSDYGLVPSYDPGFGKTFQYDVPLVEGYRYEILRNISPRPRIGTTGLLNPELAFRVSAGRYDAVVLHGYNLMTNLLALATPRHRRTRILLRGDSNAAARTSPARAVVKQGVLRTLFSRVDHFLVSGSMNRRYYERYGVSEERMTLAPFSVDNEYFARRAQNARSERARLRKELGVADERPCILYAGKLLPIKRPLDLLEAFAIARRRAAIHLVYCGDGELRAALEHRIRELHLAADVSVLGFRNQSELPALYGACDALVLPSEIESWGLVVNEVMAAGLAVAVSDRVGCAPDLVHQNGATFPVGEIDALAKILERWALEPSELQRQKAASLELIARWGIPQTADGFIEGAERAVRSAPHKF